MSNWHDACDLLKGDIKKRPMSEKAGEIAYQKLVSQGRAPKLTPGEATDLPTIDEQYARLVSSGRAKPLGRKKTLVTSSSTKGTAATGKIKRALKRVRGEGAVVHGEAGGIE